MYYCVLSVSTKSLNVKYMQASGSQSQYWPLKSSGVEE